MSPSLEMFCWLWSMGGLFAGDPSVILPVTVANLAERDVDYPFQGEYLGQSTPEACPCQYGLQVATLGEGRFEALLHEGGLPGNGGSGKSAFRLQGERSTSSFLRLEGGGLECRDHGWPVSATGVARRQFAGRDSLKNTTNQPDFGGQATCPGKGLV